MTTGQAVDLDAASERTRSEAVAGQEDLRARPVVGWAYVGLAFAAVGTYAVVRWVAAGLHRTPVGPVQLPTWMSIYLDVAQITTVIAWVIVGYVIVIRPWRR